MKKKMKITMAVLAILGLMIAVPVPVNAESPEDNFVGMWQGVDPLDGGRITLSISPSDPAGTSSGDLDLRFNDTYIRVCAPGRGIYLADASVSGNRLVRVGTPDEGQTEFDIPVSIYCYSEDKKAKVPGTLKTNRVRWIFTREGKILIMTGTLFQGEPALPDAPGGNVTMRFHKISN
jgi:hypothetical protein